MTTAASSPSSLARPERPAATRVVGHRGAAGDFPELTAVSYENAIAQGADGIETDIRLTADGVAVCLHDPHTGRVAPERRWVHRSTALELSRLDVGSWHPRYARPEPVLTLRGLLVLAEAHPGVTVFVETKHPTPTGGRVEAVLRDELRYFGLDRPADARSSRVVVMSFSVLAVRRMRALLPAVPAVQLRERRNLVKSWPAEGCGAQLMGPSIAALRARPWLVDYWRSRGMGTYCWTVNDPADVRLCQDLGVDYVATDHPARARQVVDAGVRGTAGAPRTR